MQDSSAQGGLNKKMEYCLSYSNSSMQQQRFKEDRRIKHRSQLYRQCYRIKNQISQILKSEEDSSIIKYDPFIPYRKYAGLLKAIWLDHAGKIQTICYGTGFSVSKRTVLTCAHNIYIPSKLKQCSQVIFIPDLNSGPIPKGHKIYRSPRDNFLHFQPIQAPRQYASYPLSEDLALVFLHEDMPFEQFPTVGLSSGTDLSRDQIIEIVGYPSDTFGTQSLDQIIVKKTVVSGFYHEIEDEIIYHHLLTQTGHSGAAILGLTSKSQVVVLGVHTHKGRSKNAGIFLTEPLLKKLAVSQSKCQVNQYVRSKVSFSEAIIPELQLTDDEFYQIMLLSFDKQGEIHFISSPLDKTEKQKSN